MTSIAENTFAAACFDQNSAKELQAALTNGPDASDMRDWGLTAEEWNAQVHQALKAKIEDEAEAQAYADKFNPSRVGYGD